MTIFPFVSRQDIATPMSIATMGHVAAVRTVVCAPAATLEVTAQQRVSARFFDLCFDQGVTCLLVYSC